MIRVVHNDDDDRADSRDRDRVFSFVEPRHSYMIMIYDNVLWFTITISTIRDNGTILMMISDIYIDD